MPAEAVAMPPKPNRPATMATTRNTNAQYSIVESPVLSEALRPRRRLLLTRTQMPVPGFRLPSAAPGARRRAGRRLVVLVHAPLPGSVLGSAREIANCCAALQSREASSGDLGKGSACR